MNMGKRMAVVFMAVVAVSVDVCWCSTPDHNSDSWSGWLHGVYNEAFSSEQVDTKDTATNLIESAGDTAAKTKDTVHSAASEASKYATETTGEAANKAYERASDLKDAASDKADRVIKMVAENEGGETFEKAMNYGKQKAYDAYDATKQKMNTASEKAYEAKERMADAFSCGISSPVDSYDLHADWPSDDEDEEVENGRLKGSATSYSKFDHHTERMARKAAEITGMDSDSEDDLMDHMKEGIDYGQSRLSNSYKQAKESIDTGIHKAAEKGGAAKDAVGKAMDHGHEKYTHLKDETKDKFHRASDKAEGVMGDEKRAFDESREKVGKAYESAKKRMTGEAKATYETAKEKLSEATGAVGDKMRKDKAEL